MTEEKKPAGRPKERPEGEVSLKNRLPQNLYRVLKGVSGLRGLSMNDAVTEAVELWANQYPALVAAVDSVETSKAAPSAAKKTAQAGSVNKGNSPKASEKKAKGPKKK